jgi:hypothetical protein
LILDFATGYGDFLEDLQVASLRGTTTETVATGGIYVNGADIHPGAGDISADGACTVTWVNRGGSAFTVGTFDLVFLDSRTGTSQVVRTSSTTTLLRFAPSE